MKKYLLKDINLLNKFEYLKRLNFNSSLIIFLYQRFKYLSSSHCQRLIPQNGKWISVEKVGSEKY